MGEKKNVKKTCVICGQTFLADEFGNGQCPHCNWYNSLGDGTNQDWVIFPNIVSENRARKLVAEGKPLSPALDDFLSAFNVYDTAQFIYEGKTHTISFYDDGQLEFSCKEKVLTFKNKVDFIQNAKIGNNFLRDIWVKVKEPRYL